MELPYAVNLFGYDDGDQSGDVLTRHGEILGNWEIVEVDPGADNGSAELRFFDGKSCEPKLTEVIGLYGSVMLTGQAMGNMCRRIRQRFVGTDFD